MLFSTKRQLKTSLPRNRYLGVTQRVRDIQKTAARETNLKHASKLSLFPWILFTMLQMARSVESFLKSYDICQKKIFC